MSTQTDRLEEFVPPVPSLADPFPSEPIHDCQGRFKMNDFSRFAKRQIQIFKQAKTRIF
jgi:hypothetical protein